VTQYRGRAIVLPIAVVLAVAVWGTGPAHAQKRVRPTLKRPTMRARAIAAPNLSSAAGVNAAVREVLAQKRVSKQKSTAYASRISQLPITLQKDLLGRTSKKYSQVMVVELLPLEVVRATTMRKFFKLFVISRIWPDQGARGTWAYVMGLNFNNNCKVLFDGVQAESYYLECAEFFPKSMAFKVPSGASLGSMHDVAVKDLAADTTTGSVEFKVVAPRGYRGYWGWKFSNFSWQNIPWEMYRDYFGASNVQYADGTHKPAAQSWYDAAYKKAGRGGNCYGMSVSSLRLRNNELNTYWHAWFDNPANNQDYVWDYPWQTETRQTVQEDQGAWYTQEVLDVHTNLYSTQSHRDCFNRAASLVNYWSNRPVLVIWAPNWGHTMVPYSTEVAGDDRKIIVWDNNNPYSETETGSPDPSVATVHWAANTFSYGGADKGVCLSYDECTPANPHLPGSAYGGPGSETVVMAVEPGTKLSQITDEAGRKFFNPDGTVNQNPGTRIPFSMYMPPLVQAARRTVQPRLRLGAAKPAAPRASVPSNGPSLYLFGRASGKSLTFNIAGQGTKQVNCFMRGQVLDLRAAGAGDLRMSNLLQTNHRVEVLNPAALQPTKVSLMRTRQAGDRVFELENLQNLGTQNLRLTPAADGSRLDVEAAPGAKFDLLLRGPVGQGQQQTRFGNVAIQGQTRAVMRPDSWGNLLGGGLRLELRNLRTNRLERQMRIR